IADALYYNASLTLNILKKLGVATEVFNLWFQMLQQTKKSGVRANFKRLLIQCMVAHIDVGGGNSNPSIYKLVYLGLFLPSDDPRQTD
ncbi:hypothetical protein Tco_0556783, partial [Tanacetum coccineum]